MPRRNGRERYRTKAQVRADKRTTTSRPIQLSPEVTAAITAGGKVVQNAPAGGLLCRCGVPWTQCLKCSTPVRRA